MELRHVKELMAAMQRHGTRRLVLEKDGEKLELECDTPFSNLSHEHAHAHAPARAAAAPLPVDLSAHAHVRSAADLPKAASPPPSKAEHSGPVQDGTYVKAPIVGTFYRASAPGEEPFVKVGDAVDANTVVCIIEAMKVMNEVKAGVSGVIEELVVDDGHPVDYGAKLFRVRAN